MASPPFAIAETTPGDTDPIVNFPEAERTFRDVVESWLLAEHSTSGHHTFLFNTTVERDADSTWDIGSILYNETLGCLQICTDDDPQTFTNIDFPVGTRIPFQQTTPPTNWTKESDAAYNDAIICGTTGSVGTAGTTAVGSVLTSRTIAEANLPAVTKSVTGTVASTGTGSGSGSGTAASEGGHAHSNNAAADGGDTVAEQNPNDVSVKSGGSGGATVNGGAHTHSVSVTVTVSSVSVSGSLASGVTAALGSGTAMDFAAKRFSCSIGQKAA